jgi:hypothetical protein
MAWMYAYDPHTGEYIRNKGDSGRMSLALWVDENKEIQKEHNAIPRVGVVMRVGSIYARSFAHQDWWQTTPIEEILEEFKDDKGHLHVKFRTKNSYYHWREII